MARSPDLSQAEATREHLRHARRHLDLARDLLRRQEPDFRAAAAHVEACYLAALRALTTWHRVPLPEDADVRALGERAAQFANVLRTFVRRALAVLPVLRAVGGKERLGVHDREGVEAGWYTARNLLLAVAGELPAGVREAAEVPPSEGSAPSGAPSAGR
ncbi:MAG TPA: hypothetical protein VK002_08610 [Rubricoccaceae bacterium]|nr:hypothetical protein [Rubricoccaceae bacterium]